MQVVTIYFYRKQTELKKLRNVDTITKVIDTAFFFLNILLDGLSLKMEAK